MEEGGYVPEGSLPCKPDIVLTQSGMPLRSVASTRYPSSQVSDESRREGVESFGVRANFL